MMMTGGENVDQLIKKLSEWYSDEQLILNELAHDFAQADSIEEMVIVKQAYTIQQTKVETITEAIKFAEFEQK
jgi:hypothetical protein